ncbi:MAG TPA: site-2 protease family protein [Actinomycetota bacterium]|nr:site-2 protease family protein [Actinomycetota bacterium]
MRRASIRIGSALGIELSLHATWFLVLALVAWATASGFGDMYPNLTPWARAAMGLVTGFLFFACLTVHELAHAVTARRFGIRVRGITLFVFGGVAEIEGEVPTPAREFAVALIGPAVSLGLGAAFALAAMWAEGVPAVEGVLGTLALVNLGVALFNLIPGLPLDGGRLLRAVLWRLSGSRTRATTIAAGAGVIVAAALTAFGIALATWGGEPAGLWYVPMGAFLWLLARSSRRRHSPQHAAGLALGDREGQAAQPRP